MFIFWEVENIINIKSVNFYGTYINFIGAKQTRKLINKQRTLIDNLIARLLKNEPTKMKYIRINLT